MKKLKSALGLVGILAACMALAGCNRATYDDGGSVFTYTDAQGNVVSYSAEDLLESYQTAGGSTSTEFDKVYEVLIRKYFESSAQAASLANAKKLATNDIRKDKETATSNAGTNSTTYDAEMEKIFTTNKVKNLDQLYEYHLFQEEKTIYEQNFNDSNRAAMRDGSTNGALDSTNLLFKEDASYGRANKGWIKEQVPYNIRHILVKVSAASGAYTQGEISEDTSSTAGEATKLATTIMRIAGANTEDGKTNATTNRESFGEIARLVSDDSSSATQFGELTEPMTKVLSSDLVPEFKLGTYAYETLYKDKGSVTTYGQENMATITPGLKEDATSQTEIDTTQKLDDTGTTINQFFKTGETYDDASSGIGQIPYGAAVALLKSAKVTTDAKGNNVYESKATFYPRNILFNKYFNKHNICVITPNEIAYNTGDTTKAELNDGEYSATYGALSGFQNDTTAELPAFTHNVLTNSEGQIILAVRAGTSSYQGVHFIVVQRSGLDYYGNGTNAAAAETEDVANLSEYYTLSLPSESGYPTYKVNDKTALKTTYVNYNSQQSSSQQTRLSKVNSDVKTFNGSLSTYIFQDLVSSSAIKFSDSKVEKRIQSYSKTKRQSTVDDNFATWCTNWKTYAEMIEQQNEARTDKLFGTGSTYQGSATAKDNMLSEVCAIGYSTHSGADWQQGGRCYYVK